MAEQHKIENRWGGKWDWPIDSGRRLVISDAVMSGGPGRGLAITPWALNRYERVLRLKPGETWLLKRLLALAWTFNGHAYPSFRKMSLESDCSPNTLRKYARRLEELGYIRQVDASNPCDSRKHYSVAGTYAALALCVAADPTSPWAKRHGGALSPEWASTLAFSGPGYESAPAAFDLDWGALNKLTNRHRLVSSAEDDDLSPDDVLSLEAWEEADSYLDAAPE